MWKMAPFMPCFKVKHMKMITDKEKQNIRSSIGE